MAKLVRKAVIPAAGLGTRFLPATKTVPKELLPIVDKPLLLYVMEEAVRAGIEQVILVAGRGKTAIEDFFDTSFELENTLRAKGGQEAILAELSRIQNLCEVISVRQHHAGGLGHAVLTAAQIVGNEPFAVLLPDELMISRPSAPTATQELVDLFGQRGLSSVALMEVGASEVSKYGIVSVKDVSTRPWQITGVIEKPRTEEAPSRLALPGRYVFTPRLFQHLRDTKPGRGGEIQLTDAMTTLCRDEGLLGTTVGAQRFDAGDKLGFLMANIELALARPDLGPGLRQFLKQLELK